MKINKKIIITFAGVVVVLMVGISIFYLGIKKNDKEGDDKNTAASSTAVSKNSETNDPGQELKVNNRSEGKETPAVTTNLPVLTGVFLTVYLSSQPSFSQDGKTVIPAGSLQPYAFPQGSGVYSLQKKAGNTWSDVASNVSYAGHGGIAGAFSVPTEDNINYRIIKLESGTPVSVSKTFVVSRSQITDGVKTYN